jgi:predicted phage replisome organizer
MVDMRERKYVKFRVDMYEDTKFKIIDMKPERDTMHYVWSRLVALAGKVNLDGDLYLSKNIPYTLETLAIEFNRDVAQIKLAFDVFIELEMIEFLEDKVYKVKNFAKHQNIKVKEKNEAKCKEERVDKTDAKINENLLHEINENTVKKTDNKIGEKEVENIGSENEENLEIIQNDLTNLTDEIKDEKVNNTQNNIPILMETKRDKKANKKNKRDTVEELGVINEEVENDSICGLTDGVRTLGSDEISVFEFSFG